MTIYNFTKINLSPFLIRMIIAKYQEKLKKLSNLSNLLGFLGILEFKVVNLEGKHDNSSKILPKYGNILRVNSSVYDSYNGNPFFQLVVCYHLDAIGLLYEQPRVYFDKLDKCNKTWSPNTRVKIPAGFVPQSKYGSRKKKPSLVFLMDEISILSPESFKTITVEEVDELKRQAFIKQEEHHVYLHSERNRAIAAITERKKLTQIQKNLRIARIDEKYQRNLKKYMKSVISSAQGGPIILKHTESEISQKEKSFIDSTMKCISLKVAEQIVVDEKEKEFAVQRIIESEVKLKQAEELLIKAKVHKKILEVYYQEISEEATIAEQKFSTLELQELYFEKIQSRKDAEQPVETFLKHIQDIKSGVPKLVMLFKDIQANSSEIKELITNVSRSKFSFNESTGKIEPRFELLDKDGNIVSELDISRYNNYLWRIVSNYKEQIKLLQKK